MPQERMCSATGHLTEYGAHVVDLHVHDRHAREDVVMGA